MKKKNLNLLSLLVGLMTLVSFGATDRGGGRRGGGGGGGGGGGPRRTFHQRHQICSQDPPDCDGIGVSHLPLLQTLNFRLDGWWDLNLISEDKYLIPQRSSKKVDLEGHVSITRVSQCRVKVVLHNSSFSDWEMAIEKVEVWIVVTGGSIRAVCGINDAVRPLSHEATTHAVALARSVMSASLNLAPFVDGQNDVITENDHLGLCDTQYQTEHLGPGLQELKRTRDLSRCVNHNDRKHNPKMLSQLTTEATWECQHLYHSQTDIAINDSRAAMETENPTLSKVSCYQSITLPETANFRASLNLSLVDVRELEPEGDMEGGILHELDLGISSLLPTHEVDPILEVQEILSNLCIETRQAITPKATLIYSKLVIGLKKLSKHSNTQLYREIMSGYACPEHTRVEKLYISALRDTTSSSAAAAKCQLMISRRMPFSRQWIYSLANAQEPTAEALKVCSQLLGGSHWKDAVLGVAAMAGQAVRKSCKGEKSHHCNFDNPGCPPGKSRSCGMGQAVQVIINNLAAHLPSCISRGSQQNDQVLLAIRGLGNIGAYGYDVESSLMSCGGIEVDSATRVATFAAIRHGSCHVHVTNWLKWQVLNETEQSELRITAFQSLHYCYPEEAESVALLITEKESDTQVKSYVSAFINNGGKPGDARQFSRHLEVNLTSVMGLPDTLLETDVIFQNSFLPRSIAFNLSSELLRHHGGSVQFGGRLENLEEVLQSLLGHEGSARSTFTEWIASVLHKAQDIFTDASEDFVEKHEREKRSYDMTDVNNLLRKVKKQVLAELQGWVYAGIGDFDQYFTTFNVDPFAVDWDDLLNKWLEELFEASYSFLINSDVEVTNGWTMVDQTAWSWSILGSPIGLHKQEGGLHNTAASSHINLFSLLTNPSASTLNIGVTASAGTFSVSHLSLSPLSGKVVAEYSAVRTKAFDVSAILKVQGSDSAELKIDIPQDSYQGDSSLFIRSLNIPSSDGNGDDLHDGLSEGNIDNFIDTETRCAMNDGRNDFVAEENIEDSGDTQSSISKRHCKSHFEGILGISAFTDTHSIHGQHMAVLLIKNYIKKSESSITGYSIGFSSKNPGTNSLFFDMHIEAEGTSREQKAGIVFGLTYSPHFTIKVLLHSPQLSASGEVSVVNDPNLKRLECHVGFGRLAYGFKGELLMVTDGGQVTVKPRLVISYPGKQEDALLEGYMARYWSDKVSSLALDLYTEGTLKEYLDVSLKGTAEYKAPKGRGKVLILKNIHLSTPHFSFGLESMFSLKDDAVEGKVQATWDGQVVVLDGSITSIEPGQYDKHYVVNLQLLLPDHPHIDTKITCVTKLHMSEITNNVSLIIGEGDTQREFQIIHSTSWRITNAIPTSLPTADSSAVHHDSQSYSYRGLAVRIENKVKLTCVAADLNWDIQHVLQMNNKSIENLVLAQIGDENHKLMGIISDQSEEFFKYHMEIEISLPAWHFTYVDTLQQRREGDMIGQSTTVMPSGRVYSTSSRFYKSTADDRIIIEMSYDVLVRDGGNVWKIVLQESFDWSSEHLHLQSSASLGDDTVFGLELALDGIGSVDVEFHLKNWVKNLYEGEITLINEGKKTDFNFNIIIIPFNREIMSKVAFGHDGCSLGLVDGEIAWDVRGDASRTVTLSSVIQLPNDGQPLELKGSVSVLTWTWKTELTVVLSQEVGDNHRLSYILVFPDDSKFEMGSQLHFTVRKNEVALSTIFEIQMPNEDIHNMSLVVQGLLLGNELADGTVTLNVESPTIEEVHFHIHVKAEKDETKNMVIVLKTHSEGNYWEPIEGQLNGMWNGSTATMVTKVAWGVTTINVDTTGSYWLDDDEHRISGSAEVKLPLGKLWKQLKASLGGSFSVGHNPGRLKITHAVDVEKDFKEIFNTSGEVSVHVPKAEGRLIISHAGAVASEQLYTLEGTFTGKELEVEIEGLVDEVPVKISLHYIDGQEVTVKAFYLQEDHFSISVKTELKDVSIGIRKVNGTSYSLTTEGLLVFERRRTRLHHELSISPSRGSSTLRLSPVLGNPFELTTSRIKYNNHHWRTVVSLDWGQRTFSYRDDVYFPSYSECIIKIEIDAPDLNISKVTAEVEAAAHSSGEQAVKIKYLVQNDTVHSARLMYHIHGTKDEKVWRAGARNVVLGAKEYSDLLLSHAISLPMGGMEIKSNITVGVIPVVGIGVTVTPHTRALLLSVCTTGEECVRLRAHAHARSTPSTRTYSVAAHALNSLFWSLPEDTLVQNSLTFSAEETSERVVVTGGLRRVECNEVTCENFVVRGVLHAALQITEDDLELLFDTTNRTVKFRSIVRKSKESEIVPATLPGGRLVSSSTMESQLWMDLNKDPEGMINWNSTLIRYASSRASEWVIRSGLYHQSFDKVLRLGGQIIVAPTSARMVMLCDVFSNVEDALEFNLELVQDRGNYIMTANLTKAVESHPRIMDIVVSFLPSPDSGEVSVVLIVPTYNNVNGHLPIPSYHSRSAYSDAHFSLTCGLDSPSKYTTVSCRLTAPSVNEKVYVQYQLIKDGGCKGLTTSLGVLHHNYHAHQKSCRNPNSFQASLSTKTESVQDKELALKLGVLDTKKAELDVVDAVHIMFQLHPPFLLHAMGHSRGNLWSRWEELKGDVQTELTELVETAKSVAQSLASDIRALETLAQMSAPSPAHHLATYTLAQSEKLLEELQGDELIQEITHNAQMCIAVTSLLLEAELAYLNRNYGTMIMNLGINIMTLTKVAVKNVESWLQNAVMSARDAFTSTATFTSYLPGRALDYASTIPLIGDGVQWMVVKVNQIKESYIYTTAIEVIISIGHYINWGLSTVFPISEDAFSEEFISGAWNIWVPLPECSHSLLDVWNTLSGTTRTSKHKVSLSTAVLQKWYLLTHPMALFDYFSPPFPAHGAIIGETNFITLDGQTYALNSSCSHVLLTDARDRLFTLVTQLNGTSSTKRGYTLFIGERVINVQPDLQVTMDGDSVTLPHISETIKITRNLQHLVVATFDNLGRDLLSLTCWTNQQACVFTVSGWLHSDTRGLLGRLNLDPADDFMRPSGQIALSGEVFTHSWRIGSDCPAEKMTMEIPSSNRAHQLCKKFLLDFSSPVFPCQESIDIMPYYETCIRYLASLEEARNGNQSSQSSNESNRNEQHGQPDVHPSSLPQAANDNRPDFTDDDDWSNNNVTDQSITENPDDSYSSISLQINVKDLIFPFASSENDLVDATKEELEAICNILAAYFAVCKAKNIAILLPPICGPGSKLTYKEPLSTVAKQLDLVLLVDESSCDGFMYEHLVRPLPNVLERIAHAKNISDVKMAAIGYGSGGGDIIYHIPGPSLLTSASRLKLSQPHNTERSRGSLVQGMRAVSNFPFRPGSVRVILALRCSNKDLPKFTETLTREMAKRRLTLFTLTPDLLVFNPTRPKAVRNTIGVDRWRIYSLRHDKQKSVDSWRVRKPNSNIARLAIKSGGGVFTVTPLREESRAGYYMKLFRKVLSRAIMKTVNNAYNRASMSLKTRTH